MRKNYLKNAVLFLLGIMLPLCVVAVNVGTKTKAVYTYGAMLDTVYSSMPTRVVRSYYDVNNRLARVIEADVMLTDHDQTVEVEYPGQEVPRLYTIYQYDESGRLKTVRTRKYGLYSGFLRSWADFADAESYEYDEDGRLIKKTDVTYITTYTWENGNMVDETAYYTKDGKWSNTIKYIAFDENEVNVPLVAISSDKYGNVYMYEYTYDSDGNKTVSSQYKVKDAVKDENGVVTSGVKGAPYAQTTWTYTDGILTEQLNGYWYSNSEEVAPDSKTTYEVKGDTTTISNYRYYNGKWIVFGGSKKSVSGIVDNSTSATELSVKPVSGGLNTLLLTATAPAEAKAEGWKVYRNGMLLGEAVLTEGKLSYQDTLVANGTWDYFIQQGDANTSNVVETTLNTTLPAVEGVKYLKNSLNETGDYQVILAWTKPNTTLKVLGYNVYADIADYETNPAPENGMALIATELALDTLTWLASEKELAHSIYVETVYEIGSARSAAIPVQLKKTESPSFVKAVMTMGDAMGNTGDNDVTKCETYYYDNNNRLARKMIYGKLLGEDPDDPDKIYGAGDWIPMTYTAYDYNEKGQLVNTRERQYGVFSGYNKAWNEFEQTGIFTYDDQGRILEDTTTNRVYHYKYEGDNIVQETYANSRGVIIYEKYYSNFAEGLVNCPQYAFANSPYGLTTNNRIYEYAYDEKGRMVKCYTYKYTTDTQIKDDDGNIIGAEKGTPEFEEIWTYENDILVMYEKNSWKSSKNAYEGKTRIEYTLTAMGTKAVTWGYASYLFPPQWTKGGTPSLTWEVPFDGVAATGLKAEMVAGKVNTVKLTATAPSGVSAATVWNVFRNGCKIGQAAVKRSELTFEDAEVPNGHWDYFIQSEDNHNAVGVNISNVVEIDVYTELPPVTDIRVVSNGLNTVKDYELVLDWDAPQTELPLKGYNMFVDVVTNNPSPVNGLYPFEETSYTYTAATDVNPNKEFIVEAVYNIGKIKSAVFAVKLSKENAEEPGGSEGVENITVDNLLFMVDNTLIVACEYQNLQIVNTNGALVGNYSGVQRIDLSSFAAGVYAVRLNTATGTWNGKILVK